MACLRSLAKWINTESLNILLAALTLLMAWVTFQLGRRTLSYMRDRDFELDTRNGWIEIHKAMVNLRVQRELIMMHIGSLGGYGAGPSEASERIAAYTLAGSQLLGQLDRLNDDPLLKEISAFLEDNILTKDWQRPEYPVKFDAFAKRVAFKSRPK
jgi:hypothetical protein